jgi:hypothetical protein
VSDILEDVRYFENDEVLPGNIRAVVRCAGDEITRLRAELAEAREAVGVLGDSVNVLRVLAFHPIKYKVALNSVQCMCCKVITFDLYEDDDGNIDHSKVQHSSNCMATVLRKTYQSVNTNPIAAAAVKKAGGGA